VFSKPVGGSGEVVRCERENPSDVLLVDGDSEIESATTETTTESLFDVEVMAT
jgi:hypothetical protein